MRRRYFLMRHGQSTANVAGEIRSQLRDPETCPPLTAEGVAQAEASVRRFRDAHGLGEIHIVASPFCRTRQTAEIAARILGANFRIDARLRERDFGLLDGAKDANYARIWANDEQGRLSGELEVESVAAVLARVRELIAELERADSDVPVLLCTHGDVASIALAGFARSDLNRHRATGALGTAEIRPLLAGP